MLSIAKFNALSNVAKSECLCANFPINSKSLAHRRAVYGVGANDSDYIVTASIDGKQVKCPAYSVWKGMLMRAYCPNYQAAHPTYIGVTVCNEWLSFMTFRSWWLAHQVDGWQLEKDILGDSKEYGPESCIFVPSWLNTFTTGSGATRGDFPIGVYWHKGAGKYRSYCSHPFGKNEHLGNFTNADDAHAAWLARKLEIAAELKPRMDDIDARIYPRVVQIINMAK